MIDGRGPRAEGRRPRADGRVLDEYWMTMVEYHHVLCFMVHLFNPRTSWLCRRQISPAPLAIFNKLCEILDYWIYEIYVDLLIAE